MRTLSNEQMYKLEEAVALEIDKALSPHPDNPQEFVKDLSIVIEFIAKQMLALRSEKAISELLKNQPTNKTHIWVDNIQYGTK